MILVSRKTIILVILIAFIAILPLFLIRAQSSPGLTPFGGKVVKIEYCRCSANIMITYIPVKSFMPEYLTIRPTTRIYSYGGIKRGENILGTTISPDLCVTKRKCRKTYVTQLIGIVGSSK